MEGEVNWICQECGHRWKGSAPEVMRAITPPPTEATIETEINPPTEEMPREAPREVKAAEAPKVEVPRIDVERVNEVLMQISTLRNAVEMLTSQLKEAREKSLTEESVKRLVDSSVKGELTEIDVKIRQLGVYLAFLSELKDVINALKERRKYCAYQIEPDSCKLWRLKSGEPSKVSAVECALCNTFELKGSAEWHSAIEGEFRNLYAALQGVFSRVTCPHCQLSQYAPKFLAGWVCSRCGRYMTWTALPREKR